jgi:hypothetical protein
VSERAGARKGRRPAKRAPHGIVWKNVDSVAVLIMHDLGLGTRDLVRRTTLAGLGGVGLSKAS